MTIIDNPGSLVLYREATGLEKAMADVNAIGIMDIDAEAIIDTWDPYNCPVILLPYLAWAMGVNFWNDQWSEETKRAWVAAQWEFKALRGTADAINMVVDFAGRDVSPFGYRVNKITTQPQSLYPGAALSVADREAWLETLPQVREYFFSDTGTAIVGEFFSHLNTLGPNLFTFCVPNDAASLLGRRATWVVDGVDTDVPVTDFGAYFQLRLTGPSGPGCYVGFCTTQTGDDVSTGTFSYAVPSDASRYLITIAPQSESPFRIGVGPSLMPIDARPELIAIERPRGVNAFAGSSYYPGNGMYPAPLADGMTTVNQSTTSGIAFPCFLLPSTAQYDLFNRYAVYDPNDPEPPSHEVATWFCGLGTLGFPPFTARVDASMQSVDCPLNFRTAEAFAPGSRFTMPNNDLSIEYVSGAINAARRMIDLVLLSGAPIPVFTAGSPFFADVDKYIVGQSQI